MRVSIERIVDRPAMTRSQEFISRNNWWAAAIRQHGLPNMDEFSSAVSDDVDAEQLQGVPVENELHQTFEVPDDLAAGDLLVKRTPHLIGNRRSRELFFGLADGRDFRDRVDAVGPHFGDLGLDDLEGMAGRQAALFHGGGG